MTNSEAHIPTANATSYLRQLCRHWSHKFPVSFDDHLGRIELPKAVCTLHASADELHVELATFDEEDEGRMQQVVAEHLQRFGFREELTFDWHEVGEPVAAH